MASQNKKKKAKNSYMVNGGEKCDLRLKRIMYYTKRERNRLKKSCQNGNIRKIIGGNYYGIISAEQTKYRNYH